MMSENGTYTLPRERQDNENEYLELQTASEEQVTITENNKVRFDNGNRNGPWLNQSRDAYSRTVETSASKSLKEPLSRNTFYIFIFGSILVFITGLLLGILIGYFAIQLNSHKNPKEVNPITGSQVGKNTGFNISSDNDPTEGQNTTSNPVTTTYRNPTIRAQTTEKLTTPLYSDQSKCTCPTPAVPTPISSTVTTTVPSCNICEGRNAQIDIRDKMVESPFATLTKSEIQKVVTKLSSSGLIKGRSYLGNDYINFLYLFPVDKSSALNYLDNDGPFPKRYAKVHITRGSITPPDVMIYKVGPVNESVSNMVVENQTRAGEINFNRRPYDRAEFHILHSIFRKHMDPMRDVLRESFDGASFGDGLAISYSTLFSLDENDRRSGCYLYMRMNTGGTTLNILPVSFIVHHPGVNTSAWYPSDFYYLNQGPFASTVELAEAYRNGTLRRFKLPQEYRKNNDYQYALFRNTSLPLREHSDIPPPRTYEPKGPRYTINESVVSWMDWQCEFSVNPIKGPALFDIKFKGKRIAYELSLQDISLVYASGTTGAGVDPPAISDTEFSLGGSVRKSRAGFGCPERAGYIYSTVYTSRAYKKESACVYEADAQRPMWRHYQNGLLDHHLVIRSPMNLGNYDYTLEFRFHLDGRLETIMAASGILYGAFWGPDDPLLDDDKSTSPFGFRIGEFLSGPIHTHDFVFKVDIDILGTNNSFQKINWNGGDILSALRTQTNTQEKPGFFPFNHTRYIDVQFLEKEAGLIVDPLNPSMWTIVNENEKNKWGVRRGYRIIPSFFDGEPEAFTQHLVFGPWLNMKYHCAVTKRKETEQYGTDSLYDIRWPTNPRGGLSKMMDDENIRNEDLVMWVNAKFIHAPTSEDVPMTIGVDKGFVLKPFNYFDSTPTFDIPAHYGKVDPYEKIQCYEP